MRQETLRRARTRKGTFRSGGMNKEANGETLLGLRQRRRGKQGAWKSVLEGRAPAFVGAEGGLSLPFPLRTRVQAGVWGWRYSGL